MAKRLFTVTINKRGFTLVEVLIALSITALVITGLYSAFSTTLNTEEGINSRKEGLKEYLVLSELLRADMRTMIDNRAEIKTGLYGDTLTLNTTHSLFYASSKPVRVSYYLKEIEDRLVLFRKEQELDGTDIMELRLLEGVDGFEALFNINGEWIRREGKEDFVRIVYTYRGKKWSVTAGKLL